MFVSVSSSFHVSHVHNILVRSEGFTASSAFGHGQLRPTERFRRRIKLLVVPILTVGQGGIYMAGVILLMEEILHQLIWQISHYLQGFIHSRWCRISSINSMGNMELYGIVDIDILIY